MGSDASWKVGGGGKGHFYNQNKQFLKSSIVLQKVVGHGPRPPLSDALLNNTSAEFLQMPTYVHIWGDETSRSL